MQQQLLRRVRLMVAIAMVGLVISGLTAFPIETELRWLTAALGAESQNPPSALAAWVLKVRDAVIDTNANYPFLSYGTDWLAFGHLVIALFFIGPLIDPKRYVWNLIAGVIACIGVFPLALIAGSIREIPMFWRLIDCSFGAICIGPLLLAIRWASRLEP